MVEPCADEAVGLRVGHRLLALAVGVSGSEIPHLLLAVDEGRDEAVAGLVGEFEFVGDAGCLFLSHFGFGTFRSLAFLGLGGEAKGAQQCREQQGMAKVSVHGGVKHQSFINISSW